MLSYVHLSGKDYVEYGERRRGCGSSLAIGSHKGQATFNAACTFDALVSGPKLLGRANVLEGHEKRVVRAHYKVWVRFSSQNLLHSNFL